MTVRENYIFVGSYQNEGIFFSADSGNTWTAINDGFPNRKVYSLAINDSCVFAGTYNGIWRLQLSDISNLSVSNDYISLDASNNSTTTFNITSNTKWTATSNQNWLTVSSASNFGNATVTLIAQANTTSTPRTALVTVSGAYVETQTITITQEGIPSGIYESEDNSVKVYPNPAVNILFIKGLNQNTTVSIYDFPGNLILSKHVSDNKLDISDLKDGIYIIKLETKTRIATRKLVKQ